jgi:hypothetical protein
MTNAYISVGKPEAEATCETYAANGRIKLRWSVKKQGVRMWTGFKWLRIGCSGQLLWTWVFGFNKRWEILWLAVQLLAPQGFCYMESVTLQTCALIFGIF